MSDKMIEELKEVCDHWSVRNEWGVPVVTVDHIKEVIARHEATEPLAMDKRTALAVIEYETTRARASLDGMESENRARERQGYAHAWPESCFCEVNQELEDKTAAARKFLEGLEDKGGKI